jgi:hypothetical protein
MKKILFSIALFSSFLVSAQTVIVDEKYEKKKNLLVLNIFQNLNNLL